MLRLAVALVLNWLGFFALGHSVLEDRPNAQLVHPLRQYALLTSANIKECFTV